MDLEQITGWDGDWEYTEEESPHPHRITLAAGRVLDSGEIIGTYLDDGSRLTISFDPKGDAVADTLVAQRGQNLDVASGYRAYSFAGDIPEAEGGSGPLRLIATLKRLRT